MPHRPKGPQQSRDLRTYHTSAVVVVVVVGVFCHVCSEYGAEVSIPSKVPFVSTSPTNSWPHHY